jgi:pectinesterase
MNRLSHIVLTVLMLSIATCLFAQKKIVVDAAGKGDFTTIQAALNSLDSASKSTRTIIIKAGTYNEKVFITKENVTLVGEGKDKTILTAAIARDAWRCEHPDDWGVATLNVGASDLTLKDLAVVNSFGFDYKGEVTIACASDTVTHTKKLRKDGHQMALRTRGLATRMAAINCRFSAFGGDTVSPWETNNGMWYFKDCIMEGGVDFYCPRGWAWAENCEFNALTGPAAIWHDGSGSEDSKTVLKNCRFKGYDNFFLGRYHRDAQFYLIDCSFAANMRDSDIYLVPTNNVLKWGRRIYYYNCYRDGGNDFKWYANNLPASVKASDITVDWTFHNSWKPEKK